MKTLRKLVAVATVAGVIAVTGAAYAAETAKSPVEIVSRLTGISVQDLVKEMAAGKTYGTITKENGVLDEFKAGMLENKKAILDQQVQSGRLTQEQADQIYNNMVNNQAACNGTGSGKAQLGRNSGAGFGQGNRSGLGNGAGQGTGKRQGMGNRSGMGGGYGLRDGSCGNCINR